MNIIEKLEGLLQKPVYVEVQVTQAFQPAVLADDLRAIIEEYKTAQDYVGFYEGEDKAYSAHIYGGCESQLNPNGGKLFTHPPLSDETVKDAERYRWLREQHWNESQISVVINPKVAVKLGHDCPSLKRLDSAIDEAMKAES